jgi:hypothetical protein
MDDHYRPPPDPLLMKKEGTGEVLFFASAVYLKYSFSLWPSATSVLPVPSRSDPERPSPAKAGRGSRRAVLNLFLCLSLSLLSPTDSASKNPTSCCIDESGRVRLRSRVSSSGRSSFQSACLPRSGNRQKTRRFGYARCRHVSRAQ